MSLLSKLKGGKKAKSTPMKMAPRTKPATERAVSRAPAAETVEPSGSFAEGLSPMAEENKFGKSIAQAPRLGEEAGREKNRIAKEPEGDEFIAALSEAAADVPETGEAAAGARKRRKGKAKKEGAEAEKKTKGPQRKQAIALAHAMFQLSAIEQKTYTSREDRSAGWRNSQKQYIRMAQKMIRRLEKRGIQLSGPAPKQAGPEPDADRA